MPGKSSNTVLDKSVVRVDILVLFLILEEKLLAFSVYSLWTCHRGLCYVERYFLPPSLVRVFIINGCWILSYTFANTYWDNNTIFIFHFVTVVYITLIDLCIPVNHGVLSFSHTIEYGLLKYRWKCLHLRSSGILAYNFLTCVLVWLLHQSNAGLVTWACKCLLFQFFEEFEKDLY